MQKIQCLHDQHNVYMHRRLMGKGGATIQKVQKESGSRMAVKQDQELMQEGVMHVKVNACSYA